MSRTEVYDGWSTFTCRIDERINKKGIKQYRYVIERKFVKTDDYKMGWWNKDKQKVLRRGLHQLNIHRRSVDGHEHTHI